MAVPSTFDRKTIVITGASSGMGEELARRYGKKNVNLVLASRNIEKLQKLKNELKIENCLCVKTDVSIESDNKKLIDIVLKEFGKIDLLILCSGVSYHNLFMNSKDLNIYREMMNINFFGYMYTTYYALPSMKQYSIQLREKYKRGENYPKPQIAVLSSVSGELGLPLRAGYCASKFAVNGFFKALRLEVPEIDITLILPTTVNTPMRQNSLTSPLENKEAIQFHEDTSKKISTSEACDVIIYSIEKRSKKVVFPFSNYMATLIQPFFPDLIDKIVKKKAGGNIQLESKL